MYLPVFENSSYSTALHCIAQRQGTSEQCTSHPAGFCTAQHSRSYCTLTMAAQGHVMGMQGERYGGMTLQSKAHDPAFYFCAALHKTAWNCLHCTALHSTAWQDIVAPHIALYNFTGNSTACPAATAQPYHDCKAQMHRITTHYCVSQHDTVTELHTGKRIALHCTARQCTT
jgi:hypothetical protein